MANPVRSFRLTMIGLFALSMLCAGIVTYALYRLLQLFYHTVPFESPIARVRHLVKNIGDVNVFLLVFIPLAVLFFWLFTERYAGYVAEISRGIARLASGDFRNRIDLPTNDEFGDIARDINRAGEQLLQALERGDFAESSKEQLVMNLAHDLRTPLTSVLGYLDLLLREEGLTPEQISHYTRIAFTKSQRLEKLIDELFEITRTSYGKLLLDPKPLDLAALLTQLAEEFYPVLDKHKLIARLDMPAQLTIRADGELLARVFENLLTNAVRYGQDGQFIDLRARAEAGMAVVKIINYGDCIPAAELPHIFDMFYTGDQSRTVREGRTGLGLFIAKNIVTEHGGVITAESSVPRTVFEVRLPLGELEGEEEGETL
ncbi:HAMP domain-containing histidine kinase [Paenibacillus athensensis]|uniref:histidine kinase n=1 Tax=Paenibacillus athensensis TaxID=1967502 RepID=A0A4Y8Q7F3_9BACL|nr:HAMP domain-containing sensor histidine kinase [Paenibacillus athensensis]MCD1257321.1 HAMP domain-containing histidine kinase [Paenibacillus athensensis]